MDHGLNEAQALLQDSARAFLAERFPLDALQRLAVGAQGGVTAVWQSRRQAGGRYGCYLQRFSVTGEPIGSERVVDARGTTHALRPMIAGDWLAWQTADARGAELWLRRTDGAEPHAVLGSEDPLEGPVPPVGRGLVRGGGDTGLCEDDAHDESGAAPWRE